MFANRVSRWRRPEEVVIGGTVPALPIDELLGQDFAGEPERQMMLVDLASYLADDILVKVDRASMAASLEVRSPLLDHRVVELATRLPFTLKYREGKTKWVLRQLLARYVPPGLTDRPKTGFGSPIRQWLRGELADWGEALLDASRLEREGFFRPALVRQLWEENRAGRRSWHNHLWPVLMFQAWLAR
jgi:asparagine synthase (glutamine-hydrolysing)